MIVQARWWDGVMAAGLIACAVLLAASSPFNRSLVSWGALIAFALVYVLLARRQFGCPEGPMTLRLFLSAALPILILGIAVYSYPALATLQCVAYPLVWTLPWRLRAAIVANGAIGAAVFLGYGLSPATGEGLAGWLTALGVAVLSVIFSLVIGIWISRIVDYGTERARLLDQLTAAQDELAAMHREAGETSERARLARELHDTVTQTLTGLVMLAERAGTSLRAQGRTDASAQLDLIEATAREALAEARALVTTMTPATPGSGLADALGRLAARFERETGVVVETRVCERRLPREQEVVLLRCAQEGLANVRKHARASHVAVEIVAREAGAESAISLRVIDDGVGPDAASSFTDGGFGIAGMRERVGMLGGRLTLAARPGGGAELAVTMPLVPGIAGGVA
ncbi:sensor histidine kinase [Gryllotalpicola reticulitermitis]|uniref:histidine kinase n=1 Tax=Gryllotalpicola reticulitermitis TaxID=1184153 RepID=A0ABV8Q7Y3_9MICO